MRIQTADLICPPMRPNIGRLIVTMDAYKDGYSVYFNADFDSSGDVVRCHYQDPVLLMNGLVSVETPSGHIAPGQIRLKGIV